MLVTEKITTWPYSTLDEVSHLVIEDVGILRARIDMLLEERANWNANNSPFNDIVIPVKWGLTAAEDRFFRCLLQASDKANNIVSKEQCHKAISDTDEPETEIDIVNIIACRVRKKLSVFFPENFQPFETVWGRGYKISPSVRDQLLLQDGLQDT